MYSFEEFVRGGYEPDSASLMVSGDGLKSSSVVIGPLKKKTVTIKTEENMIFKNTMGFYHTAAILKKAY
jgi:hypothetical protein